MQAHYLGILKSGMILVTRHENLLSLILWNAPNWEKSRNRPPTLAEHISLSVCNCVLPFSLGPMPCSHICLSWFYSYDIYWFFLTIYSNVPWDIFSGMSCIVQVRSDIIFVYNPLALGWHCSLPLIYIYVCVYIKPNSLCVVSDVWPPNPVHM